MIVRVADASNVATVIGLARDTGLELAIRGGGHSGAGHRATDGGILLDLRDMMAIEIEIEIEGRTTWAETGLIAAESTEVIGVQERTLETTTQGAVRMRFRTTILQSDKTATGIRVPDEVVAALGSGKRPAVTITINGFTYRSTIAVMGGAFMVGVSAENRAGAGVTGGDDVDVDIELDLAPREVTVPADVAAALDAEPRARATYERLSYSNKSWHVLQVTGAKTDETRQRRIAKSIEALRDGRIR